MQALAVSSADFSTGGRETPMRLVERRLRELVCNDSKPVSPKSSQTSGNNDGMPPFLDQESSHLGVFSEIEAGEEVLLPGEWPLNQVSSLCAEDVVNRFNRGFIPPPVVENCTAEWVHHAGMAGPSRSHLDAGMTMGVMDMLGTAHIQQHAGIPEYFKEYYDRMLLEARRSNDRGEGPYPLLPSSQVSASRRTHVQQTNIPGYLKEYYDRLVLKPGSSNDMGEGSYPSPSSGVSASYRMYGRVSAWGNGGFGDNFTCGMHDM